MESTSSPDNGRQSRGLARFWPVHGLPAPGQRQSDEDEAGALAEAGDAAHADADAAEPTHDGAAAVGTRAARDTPVTGEQPLVGDGRPGGSGFGLTGEMQMVALGHVAPDDAEPPQA